MDTGTGYKRYFGYELAERLSVKIAAIHPRFPAAVFLADIRRSNITELELLARVNLLAAALRRHLPEHYPEALETLEGIYGQENPNETGMFTFGYWLWPVASFIAAYGLEHYELGWAESTNVHVKRLGSEDLRPRLPWSKKLTIFWSILNQRVWCGHEARVIDWNVGNRQVDADP